MSNMLTGPPLFPPLVPHTIEYLVNENDEDATLTKEEAKLEAQVGFTLPIVLSRGPGTPRGGIKLISLSRIPLKGSENTFDYTCPRV